MCFQGLYPASHGIIDNSMYDTASGKLFKVGRNTSLEPFWWEKEPVRINSFKIVGQITSSGYTARVYIHAFFYDLPNKIP